MSRLPVGVRGIMQRLKRFSRKDRSSKTGIGETGNGETGIGKFTLIVFGAIAAVVLFVGYNILPFYYYYYELQNQMKTIIRVASMEPDKEIRRRLMYHIKKMQLPVDPEDLIIQRDGDMMYISLEYQEVFYITWQGEDHDIHVFDFHAKSSGKIQ